MSFSSSRSVSGSATVAGASALFGSIGVFVHFMGDTPFFSILAYRFAFSVLAFGAIAAVSTRLRSEIKWRKDCKWEYVALGASIGLMNLAFYYAIQSAGMGLATILIGTAPMFVTLANWGVWRVHPQKRVLAGMGIGFSGVILIAGASFGRISALGLLAGVGAGVAYAAWMLASRAATAKGASSGSQGFMSILIATAVYIPLALAVSPALPSATGWAAAAALGAVVGLAGPVLLARGVAMISVARAGVITYIEPLTAVTLGVVVLGEAYTTWQMLGGALVLGGMLVVSVTHPHHHHPDAQEAHKSRQHVPRRERAWKGPGTEKERRADGERSRSQPQASSLEQSGSSSTD